jgi:hypothetical protein
MVALCRRVQAVIAYRRAWVGGDWGDCDSVSDTPVKNALVCLIFGF